MPEMPDVTSGEAVESAWGNQIRDRTVQRYADSTERDALVPLPVAGDLAWLDDEAQMTVYSAAGWLQVVSNQGGLLEAEPYGLAFKGTPASMRGLWSGSPTRRYLRMGDVKDSFSAFVQVLMGDDSGAGANNTGGQISLQLRNGTAVLIASSGAAAGGEDVTSHALFKAAKGAQNSTNPGNGPFFRNVTQSNDPPSGGGNGDLWCCVANTADRGIYINNTNTWVKVGSP